MRAIPAEWVRDGASDHLCGGGDRSRRRSHRPADASGDVAGDFMGPTKRTRSKASLVERGGGDLQILIQTACIVSGSRRPEETRSSRRYARRYRNERAKTNVMRPQLTDARSSCSTRQSSCCCPEQRVSLSRKGTQLRKAHQRSLLRGASCVGTTRATARVFQCCQLRLCKAVKERLRALVPDMLDSAGADRSR